MCDDGTEAPMLVGGITLAPPGWKAHFKSVPDEDAPVDDEGEDDQDEDVGGEGEEDESPTAEWTAHDVVAFDAEGNALIVDQTRGRLVPANSYSDFAHVQPMDEGPVYSAFLPGGGWRIAHGRKGEEPQVRDVVAWAITAWGDATPIHVDPAGHHEFVWAAAKADPEYAHLKYLPPAHTQPTAQPNGRATVQPNGRTVGGDGSAHVGEAVGDEVSAHPQPNGRKKAQPTRQPKGSPNGRAKSQPMRTPTIDDLSPTERDRLRILGEHFPDEVPGRDAVCEYMRAHGIAGFGNKGRTQVLVQVLSASRAQFAQMTEQEVKA